MLAYFPGECNHVKLFCIFFANKEPSTTLACADGFVLSLAGFSGDLVATSGLQINLDKRAVFVEVTPLKCNEEFAAGAEQSPSGPVVDK